MYIYIYILLALFGLGAVKALRGMPPTLKLNPRLTAPRVYFAPNLPGGPYTELDPMQVFLKGGSYASDVRHGYPLPRRPRESGKLTSPHLVVTSGWSSFVQG